MCTNCGKLCEQAGGGGCVEVENIYTSWMGITKPAVVVHKTPLLSTRYPQSLPQRRGRLSTQKEPENKPGSTACFPVVHVSTITTANLNYQLVRRETFL